MIVADTFFSEKFSVISPTGRISQIMLEDS